MKGDCIFVVYNFILFTCYRTAQPKADPNDCKLIFEKGKAIEHEFAGYFTGMLYVDNYAIHVRVLL